MSEILTIEKISLGRTEEYFLSMFITYSELSAYDISQELKRQTKTGEPRVVDAMAYKNVHEKIKRLQSLKLIKQLNKKFPRRAIKYVITNRGLFQVMLSKYAFNVAFYLTSSYVNLKGHLINSILFQFFEVETINQFFTYYSKIQLGEYLRNCCEAIQNKLERFSLSNTRTNDQKLYTEFENLIKSEARKFIFKIVVESEKNYESMTKSRNEHSDPSNRYLYPEIAGQDPDHDSLFPKAALNSDKKFLKLLKEMKDDFERGFKDYLYSLEKMS